MAYLGCWFQGLTRLIQLWGQGHDLIRTAGDCFLLPQGSHIFFVGEARQHTLGEPLLGAPWGHCMSCGLLQGPLAAQQLTPLSQGKGGLLVLLLGEQCCCPGSGTPSPQLSAVRRGVGGGRRSGCPQSRALGYAKAWRLGGGDYWGTLGLVTTVFCVYSKQPLQNLFENFLLWIFKTAFCNARF